MHIFPSIKKSLYLRIPWVRWNIVCGALLNASLWAFVYGRVEPRTEPVALHASVYFGIDMTAPYWHFYFFPLGGLVVLCAHVLVSRWYFRTEPLLSLMLLSTSTLLQGTALGIVALLTKYL